MAASLLAICRGWRPLLLALPCLAIATRAGMPVVGARGAERLWVPIASQHAELLAPASIWRWQRLRLPVLTATVAADASTGWAAGADGSIFKTADGGQTWSAQPPKPDGVAPIAPVWLRGIALGAPGVAWAVGGGYNPTPYCHSQVEWAVLRSPDGGATWQTPAAGRSGGVRAVAAAGASTAWVVAEGPILGSSDLAAGANALAKTTDGGATWTHQFGNGSDSLEALVAVSGDVVWAVGSRYSPATHGIVVATQDGGATWQAQTVTAASRLSAVAAVSATTAWAVGTAPSGDGVILKTTDGGATWVAQAVSSAPPLQGVSAVSASTAWVVGSNGVVLATTDGGATWSTKRAASSGAGSLSGFAIAGGSAANAWIVGTADGIGGVTLRTADAGATWTEPPVDTTPALRSVSADAPTSAWTVGDGGTILRTRDGGATWTDRSTSNRTTLIRVAAVPSAAWVVRESGTLLRTDDDGATWTEQISPTSDSRVAWIAPASPLVAWAGRGGTLLKTLDGGQTWSSQNLGTTAYLTDAAAVSGSEAWAIGFVGQEGAVFHTSDGGATWARQSIPPSLYSTLYSVDAIAAASASVAWLIGSEFWDPRCSSAPTVLLATVDGGTTWTRQSYGTSRQLAAIAAASPLDAWLFTRNGEVLATTDGGASWTTQLHPARVALQAATTGSTTSLWAVGARGGILRGTRS